MKTIAIINQKGGVGKTTSALELAYLFGEKGKTLVIDLDGQRNLSMYTGAKLDAPGIYEVLNAEILPEDAIQHVYTFDLLISNKNLANSAKEFGEPDDIYLLKDVLENLDYDYVIIDNAPARSPLLYMTYIASDAVIPITECDDGSIEGINELYTDMQRFIKRRTSNAKILGILMTKYEKTTMHDVALDTLNELAEQIGTEVFNTKIRKAIAVSESKTAREPVNVYQRYNNAALDYRHLTDEIIAKLG